MTFKNWLGIGLRALAERWLPHPGPTVPYGFRMYEFVGGPWDGKSMQGWGDTMSVDDAREDGIYRVTYELDFKSGYARMIGEERVFVHE